MNLLVCIHLLHYSDY